MYSASAGGTAHCYHSGTRAGGAAAIDGSPADVARGLNTPPQKRHPILLPGHWSNWLHDPSTTRWGQGHAILKADSQKHLEKSITTTPYIF